MLNDIISKTSNNILKIIIIPQPSLFFLIFHNRPIINNEIKQVAFDKNKNKLKNRAVLRGFSSDLNIIPIYNEKIIVKIINKLINSIPRQLLVSRKRAKKKGDNKL